MKTPFERIEERGKFSTFLGGISAFIPLLLIISVVLLFIGIYNYYSIKGILHTSVMLMLYIVLVWKILTKL